MSQAYPPHATGAYAPQQTVPAPTAEKKPSSGKGKAVTIWIVIGVLLFCAVASAIGSLQRTVYGPQGLVSSYLDALTKKDAATALDLPGVALDDDELKAAGLPEGSSDGLLRGSVLVPLSEVEFVSDEAQSDGTHEVTYDYEIGERTGTTTFTVKKTGGLFGSWEFAVSPLAAVNLTVNHTTLFSVNGFDADTRQVSPEGTPAAFSNIANVLVFTPAIYTFTTDTDYLTAADVNVFADTPGAVGEASIDAQPTEDFIAAAQEQVNAALDECASQLVLQPTGCPFGYYVEDRISGDPTWSIDDYPAIELKAGSDSWTVSGADGDARIEVDVQSLADGSITHVDTTVDFELDAAVYLFSDGTITAQVLPES